MRLTAKLTLDGLIQGLRWRQHSLAEEGSERYDPARRRSRDHRTAGQQDKEAPDGSTSN